MVLVMWNLYQEHARVFNMIMLMLVVAGLTTNMILRRPRMNRRTRRIFGWLFALLLNFVYAYSIAIREHRPYNPSIGVGSLLLIGTFAAIIWHPEGDSKRPPYDGALTSRFMFWLDNQVLTYRTRHMRKHKKGSTMSESHSDPIVEEDDGTPQPNPYQEGTDQQETGEDVPDPEGYSDDTADD